MKIVIHGGAGRRATIRRLCFPFPIAIEVIEGSVWYMAGGHARLLRQHQRVHSLPFSLCDIGVSINGFVLIQSDVTSIQNDSCVTCAGRETKILTHQTAQDLSSTVPLTHILALRVFRAPHVEWTPSLLASVVAMPKRKISRQFFSQGESFRQIVHTQRLTRFFCDLHKIAHVDDSVARKYGFAHVDRLEDAVYEQFDLTLDCLRHMFGCRNFPASGQEFNSAPPFIGVRNNGSTPHYRD
ncbi:hypothetical protein SAMN04515618_107180 [Collimonas sp. OK307]|uniref:hypothetical protein n=1 Tax=Collimonas sp. OK307 TaxID=1801620 RepID=UPI0008E6FEE6|nr:hypothetical protein [Collimonas sp. OK307]SFI00400.1 hypothetical protein SAMN04515618_107180 [Collimonas sp. OK307]